MRPHLQNPGFKIDLRGFLYPFGETNASHGLRCPPPSFLTVGGDTPEKPDSQAPLFSFEGGRWSDQRYEMCDFFHQIKDPDECNLQCM